MSDEMYNQAVQALRAGQRLRARDLLTRLLKVDQGNPNYWLWMSATVDSEKEQVYCLQQALRLNPNSIAARRGLVVLGALPPEEANLPPAHAMEAAAIALPEVAIRGGILGRLLGRRRSRERLAIAGVGGVAVIVVALACLAVVAPERFRPRQFVVVTSTPLPTSTPVPTERPVATATVICGIPAVPDPATPLAVYVCATQTATPFPWPTDLPGAMHEDYNTLKREFLASNWAAVIQRYAIVANDPQFAQDPRPDFFAAEAYRHTGNLAQAVEHYRTALARDSGFAPAYWGKALAEVALGQPREALADFDEAIAFDQGFAPAHIDRAIYLALSGNPVEAVAGLQLAAEALPRNALVRAHLAVAYADSGQLDEALEAAEAALAMDPGLALAYYARGRAALAVEDYERAAAEFSRAHQYLLDLEVPEAPRFAARVLYHTGLAQAGLGEDRAALAFFNQAARLDESFAALRLARGALHLAAGRYEDAAADLAAAADLYERSAPTDPARLRAYVALGQAYLKLGQANEALASFQTAVRGDPMDYAAQLGLGQAQLLVNRPELAVDSFGAALDAAQVPGDRALALYGRAQAYAALNRMAEAMADLQAAARLAGKQSTLAPTVAARLTEIGPLPTDTSRPTTPTRTATPSRTPTRTVASPTQTPANTQGYPSNP